VSKSNKYYSKGFKYLVFSEDESLFKYAVFLHKNKNGAHFDVRLASAADPSVVYSWSAKKNPLDKEYPVPMRRVKDHPEQSLSPDTNYTNKNGDTSNYKTLAEGDAELVEIDKTAGLLFETDNRNFRIIPQRGKRYLFHEID
jgi:hypothetical protein|tara:strand:+ start:267 stop:692 length:426 start_codon:yes stop_codon:yes gene_type:complete